MMKRTASLAINMISHWEEEINVCFIPSNIGLSGVRALPVAAGTNEGGHYFWYFSTVVVVTLLSFTPEGIVVGF